MRDKLKILFLCTGNSCRSQMAEGWTRHLQGDTLEAYSAGVVAKGLNPNAIKVMQEAGVDITSQQSQTMQQIIDLGIEPDIVVTVCQHAHENCPVFPAKARIVHHGFDDPPLLAENEPDPEIALGHYRRVRDEIKAFAQGLPDNLGT
ncbi:arsenate reductase ArsC [Mucisphaera calidilacus]|uniref:Arsenate-mycothiol transferase ArsC2 n=1 Tax=Mucisphaera calidilacus TaxID=2527982 RepID=A0A518BYS5_9BACT|nr:arsenate reductase ArsC [Mucisphaera calidilacus]QDU72125.1 Arsenate-mycothiol transferase ArsC2 [Mucisphaera calidilacus]